MALCEWIQGRRAVMVTMCGVLENEGAKQMAAALIKWPVMMASMQQVCSSVAWMCFMYMIVRYDMVSLNVHCHWVVGLCVSMCAEQTGDVAICGQTGLQSG